MKRISLDGKWQLSGKRENLSADTQIKLTASVPGCVQLDLSEAGFLPKDLFFGENITEAEKYEEYEWWYEKRFTYTQNAKNAFLVFEGVDCLAKYYLNGRLLGESDNMFISHEFPLDGLLLEGENVLTVHIRSAILEADKRDYPLKLINPTETTDGKSVEGRYVRKAPHSYGWDIMPRAVTAGIWRSVFIEERDEIYFSQHFFLTNRENTMFFYKLEGEYSQFHDVEIELFASCGDSYARKRVKVKKKAGAFAFEIENPKLWFPYGYGDANVYDGYLKVYRKESLIHEMTISFGIRDVTLDRRDRLNGDDGIFRILINGIEIMCKGSNWVPLDAFHSRDSERYDRALELTRDIGCNILRCWGGNVYEDHKFFDFCDRNGIMVWQDFAFSCVRYPEDDEFKAQVKKEVTAVIRKLRNHPSLIIWAGDNEIDSTSLFHDPNTYTISRTTIAKCVDENDIARPYLQSSPYISEAAYTDGQRSQVLGSKLVEDHLWGPRDYFKSDFYKYNQAHFVSETGYHGCPSLDSIKKFISPDKVWPYKDNSEWILHSSDQNGDDSRVMLMEHQVRQLFGFVPTEPEDYILASQISQAEAKKYFIERMRVRRPDKTGIIWWNLLDGWPQMSDAVVDYYFNKKLAYGYIKRSQAPFTIAADEISDWTLSVFACNDTLKEKKGTLKVKDALSDELLYEGDFLARVNTSTKIAALPIYYSDRKILIFEWSCENESGFNHYVAANPPIPFDEYKRFLERYITK